MNDIDELDYYASRTVAELRRQIAAQHRYIEQLERQLEPSVIAEIREELEQNDRLMRAIRENLENQQEPKLF